MKKSIILILIIASMLSGCSSEPNKQVWQVETYGGAVAKNIEVADNPGFLAPMKDIEKDPRYPQKKTIEISGKQYQTVLESSKLYEGLDPNSPLYDQRGYLLYKAGKEYFFVHPDSGEVIGYYNMVTFLNENPGKDETVSEEAIEKTAMDYLCSRYEDANEYQLIKSYYQEYAGQYRFCYNRLINGQPTADFVEIEVALNGEIYVFLPKQYQVYEAYREEITQVRTTEALERMASVLGEKSSVDSGSITIFYGNDRLYIRADFSEPSENERIANTYTLFTEY